MLLDYDGVVLRSKKALQYQSIASNEFAFQVLKAARIDVSRSQCAKINRQHYKEYGHTVNMLRTMFDAKVTLSQYNAFVFDEPSLRRSLSNIDTTESMAEAHRMVSACLQSGIESCIFTNAHPNWVKHTARGIVRELPIIHPGDDIGALKPFEHAYRRVEEAYDEENFLFIDDSLANCEAAKKISKRWIGVHFDTDFDTSLRKHHDRPCEQN